MKVYYYCGRSDLPFMSIRGHVNLQSDLQITNELDKRKRHSLIDYGTFKSKRDYLILYRPLRSVII